MFVALLFALFASTVAVVACIMSVKKTRKLEVDKLHVEEQLGAWLCQMVNHPVPDTWFMPSVTFRLPETLEIKGHQYFYGGRYVGNAEACVVVGEREMASLFYVDGEENALDLHGAHLECQAEPRLSAYYTDTYATREEDGAKEDASTITGNLFGSLDN